ISQFTPLPTYTYYYRVNDPDVEVILKENRNDKPVLVVKNVGRGRIIYAGLLLYYDSDLAGQILANAVKWAAQGTNPSIHCKIKLALNLDQQVYKAGDTLKGSIDINSACKVARIVELRVWRTNEENIPHAVASSSYTLNLI